MLKPDFSLHFLSYRRCLTMKLYCSLHQMGIDLFVDMLANFDTEIKSEPPLEFNLEVFG